MNGNDIRALVANGFLYNQRYPNFVKWVRQNKALGNVDSSIEIMGLETNDNKIIYEEAEPKDEFRTPKEFVFSGTSILSVSPADDNAIVLEVAQKQENKEDKTLDEKELKELIQSTISETNSKPNIKSYDKKFILQALLHECPVTIKAVDSLENNKVCEWNKEDNVLYICRNDDADLIIKSVATELAKVGFVENNHDIDIDIDNEKADCVSYMICKKYGIDASINSIDNLCSKYSNMENPDIANDLTSMKEVLLDINNRMSNYLDEKRREVTNKEQER